MRILLSILISIAPILGFAQTTGKVLEANAASGIQSVPNFVINSNAEKNTNAILQSGGTLSRDCSGPEVINGTCSFDWISDTSGQYLKFTANTMPEGSKGFTCSAYMRFQMDTLGAAASAYVVVEDGSGNAISPQTQLYATYNSVAAANDGTTGLALIEGYPCKPNQENRFAIYRSASTSARIHFDEVHVVQFPNSMAAPARAATNEATYTPTYTGFGTVSTSNMKWYQDGQFIYVYGSFVAGTPTAVEARMSLPTGYTSSSTISTLMLCGDNGRTGSSTTYFREGILCEPSVTYVTFGAQTSTTNVVTKYLGNSIITAGQTLYVNAKIPIAGANNANAIPASCINNPDCQNNFSAKVSVTGVVSDENFSFINGNAGLASSVYTLTWDSSRFSVAPNCAVSLSGASSGAVKLTSVSTTTATVSTYNSTFAAADRDFTIICSRAGTDVKPWGPIPWLTGMVSSNSTSSIRSEFAGLTCSAASTIDNQSALVTSIANAVDNGSTRSCALTISSGFSAGPRCTATQIVATAGTVPVALGILTGATSSSVTVVGPDADYSFNISCPQSRN